MFQFSEADSYLSLAQMMKYVRFIPRKVLDSEYIGKLLTL